MSNIDDIGKSNIKWTKRGIIIACPCGQQYKIDFTDKRISYKYNPAEDVVGDE